MRRRRDILTASGFFMVTSPLVYIHRDRQSPPLVSLRPGNLRQAGYQCTNGGMWCWILVGVPPPFRGSHGSSATWVSGDRERPAPSIKPKVDMRTAAAVLHQARQLDEFRRGVNEHFAPDRWPNPNRTQVVSTAP